LSSAELDHQLHEGVARLSLNRPARRNAISESLFVALRDALHAVDRNELARVVVLRSAVPGIFCAGADVETMADERPAELERHFDLLLECLDAFRSCSKPIVTVVQAGCLGAGCSLAAASDIVIAGADARFSLPEIKLNLAPVLAMAALAPVMQARRLFYWSATGRSFSADEACEIGLVTEVVAAAEIDAFANKLIAELVRTEPAAMTQIKRTARMLVRQLGAATDDILMNDMIATATHPAARRKIREFLQPKNGAGAAPAV
jgi:enoyl-CoA hydratase/carnithine racemase